MTRFAELRSQLRKFYDSSLHRNSAALILDQLLLGGFGFIFWLVAAHYGPPSMVGRANAVIGILGLLGVIGTLGLPLTIVRFWPQEADPEGFFLSSLLAVSLCGLAIGGLWFVTGSWGVPHSFSDSARVTLSLAVALGAAGALTTAGLIARRSAPFVVAKDVLGIVARFGILAALVGSAMGLVTATIISALVGTFAGITFIFRHSNESDSARRHWTILLRRVTHRIRFALTTHAAAVVATVPLYLLPAMFVQRLGSTQAAFISIPLLVAYTLNSIPQATSNAMLAEISHDEAHALNYATKALKSIYVLAVPAVLVLILLSSFILGIFGHRYSVNGTTCLRLMSFSVLFSCANYVGDTFLLAKQRIRTYFAVNFLGTVAVLFWILLLGTSPTGAGEGWLAGQISYLLISAVGLTLTRNRRSPRSAFGHAQ